jgi:hypothetical protein
MTVTKANVQNCCPIFCSETYKAGVNHRTLFKGLYRQLCELTHFGKIDSVGTAISYFTDYIAIKPKQTYGHLDCVKGEAFQNRILRSFSANQKTPMGPFSFSFHWQQQITHHLIRTQLGCRGQRPVPSCRCAYRILIQTASTLLT